MAGLASPTTGQPNSQSPSAAVGTPGTPDYQTLYSDLYGPGVASGLGNMSPNQATEILKSAGLSDAEANQVLMDQLNALQGAGELSNLKGPQSGIGDSTLSGTTLGGGSAGGPSSPVNGLGAASGAFTGGAGLLNLLQSLQSGNTAGAVGGGLQGAGGLTQLLSGLGQGSATLSGIGGAAGGLGGLLSIIQGIRGLGNGETPLQAASNIGGGLSGLYSGAAPIINSLGGIGGIQLRWRRGCLR